MDNKQIKEQVYRANMELFERHLVVYTWGNVSQVDRERGVFYIKPSGVPYEDLTPEMMVCVSLENGEALDGRMRPSSDASTHLALYRAFVEIGGITHTHSTRATAWSQAGKPIPPLGTTHADYFRGEVPVTRYLTNDEIAGDYEYATGTVIAECFEFMNPLHTPAVLVRGHGPFAWGKDAADSVYHAVVLEEVATMAMHTFLINATVNMLPGAVQDKHFNRKHGPNAYYGQDCGK